MINPLVVEGQIHGGIAHGIGNALIEEIVYDPAGQLATGTLMDYALPRATDVPSLEVHHIVTPSPLNPLGVKGAGEGATVGAPGAVIHAILDALAPLGVTDIDMPATPEQVWRAIQIAEKGRSASLPPSAARSTYS
jgi:carbon-monoxide dehydrogenase large subunit